MGCSVSGKYAADRIKKHSLPLKARAEIQADMANSHEIFLPGNRLLGVKYGDTKKVIPIFITHMGCPNQCVFCDQRHISGSSDSMTPERVMRICDTVLHQRIAALADPTNQDNLPSPEVPAKHHDFECAFYGGSFTGLDMHQMEEYLRIPFARGLPVRLSTRPDYISEKILLLLKQYNVRTIELGVQSMDDSVLQRSKRNHTAGQTVEAVRLIRRHGFELGIQTMIGLPGDTEATALATSKTVCDLQPDLVRIYPALVLRDTELYELYNAGLYEPMSLIQAISLSARLLDMYDKAQIRVIRLGLQSGGEISSRPDSKVAAGPFHSAFRQLTESYLLASYLADAAGAITAIECGRDAVQFVRGHTGFGLDILRRAAGHHFDVRINPALEPNIIKVFNSADAKPRTVVL
ncbi:MAG: elongator complex protein 3 [Saccharofermentanales bacterium]